MDLIGKKSLYDQGGSCDSVRCSGDIPHVVVVGGAIDSRWDADLCGVLATN